MRAGRSHTTWSAVFLLALLVSGANGASRDLQAAGSKGPKAKPVPAPSEDGVEAAGLLTIAKLIGPDLLKWLGTKAWEKVKGKIGNAKVDKACATSIATGIKTVSDDYKASLTALTNEINGLKKYKTQVFDLLTLLSKLKAQLNACKSSQTQLNTCKTQLAAVQKSVKTCQTERDTLQGEMADLQGEMEDLQGQLENCDQGGDDDTPDDTSGDTGGETTSEDTTEDTPDDTDDTGIDSRIDDN